MVLVCAGRDRDHLRLADNRSCSGKDSVVMIDVSVVTLLSFLCIKYRNYICQQQHSISFASTPPNGDTGGDHISHPLSLLTHLSQYINRYIPRSIRFNSNMANSDSSSPHFLQTQHTFARVGACRGQYSQGLLAGNWMMWLLLLLSTVVYGNGYYLLSSSAGLNMRLLLLGCWDGGGADYLPQIVRTGLISVSPSVFCGAYMGGLAYMK